MPSGKGINVAGFNHYLTISEDLEPMASQTRHGPSIKDADRYEAFLAGMRVMQAQSPYLPADRRRELPDRGFVGRVEQHDEPVAAVA